MPPPRTVRLASLRDPSAWLEAVAALHLGEDEQGVDPRFNAMYTPQPDGGLSDVDREVAARPPHEP
eukprot:949932-Prymnesium_polylepis.1